MNRSSLPRHFMALSFVCLLLSACQKIDFKDIIDQKTKQCNCASASSDALFDWNEEPVLFLFKKVYKPGTNELKQLIIAYRNVAIPPLDPWDTLNVSYQGRDAFFVRSAGDTLAKLKFNNQGVLLQAVASPWMYPGDPVQTFSFTYAQNKLRNISFDGGDGYIGVQYEQSRRNGSKVLFTNPGEGAAVDSIVYTYDYTRRAKEQLYPDEMKGGYYNFWYFIKDLDILEELEPENLLVRSFMTNEYPEDIERVYSNHVMDAGGKLISYKQASKLSPGPESWWLTWRCK